MRTFYPLISAILANLLAQLFKPLFYYLRTGKRDLSLVAESGGFPSSHTSMVIGLTFAIAYQEGFDSNFFFICVVFSLITTALFPVLRPSKSLIVLLINSLMFII